MEEPTASNTTPGLRAGARFGHYRLKKLLGRGGFGEVYEAEDTMMDRAVALKLLAVPYSQNAVFRQRLYREARNAGRLHEPHVVPIHRCGEIDGQLYIDMRLIEGTDLQKVLARDGPLSPARAGYRPGKKSSSDKVSIPCTAQVLCLQCINSTAAE